LFAIPIQIERQKVRQGAEPEDAGLLQSVYDRHRSVTIPKLCRSTETAMPGGIQWFIHRLIERLIPLLATSFSSAVQTLHALDQAEQQNQLEEAARRYEADGKTEIASALRRRAAALTSDNPAAEALDIVENVVAADQKLLSPGDDKADSALPRLPDFAGKPSKPRRKKPTTRQPPSDRP
jgi:hypothetical protein